MKKIKCLKCDRKFVNSHKFNRICNSCNMANAQCNVAYKLLVPKGKELFV